MATGDCSRVGLATLGNSQADKLQTDGSKDRRAGELCKHDHKGSAHKLMMYSRRKTHEESSPFIRIYNIKSVDMSHTDALSDVRYIDYS